jgi:hypothetical protein
MTPKQFLESQNDGYIAGDYTPNEVYSLLADYAKLKMIEENKSILEMTKPTIGLFGTCGNSTWRQQFMEIYNQYGIEYFNPQKDNWSPEDAIDEAKHLANDEIILFPVTSETYATGSLAEVGFSILQAIKLDDRREFIIMIDNNIDQALKENVIAAKESIRARALVREHLKKIRLSNLYLVETLDEMLEVSLNLYKASEIKVSLKHLNPHIKYKE